MRKIKLWIELLYIFLLPIIFIGLSIKLETTKEYDENNNEISKESYIKWEYPYNDFKSNEHYINKLYFNQLIENIEYTISANENNAITFNLINNHKYLINIYYSRLSTSSQTDYQTFMRKRVGSSWSTIIYQLNTQPNRFFNCEETTSYSIGWATYSNFTSNVDIKVNIIDLTKMFGEDYEPQTTEELQNYIDLSQYYNYTEEEEIIYYSENTNISKDWKYNYTPWGEIYNNIIIKNLYLNDNVTTRFIMTYIITWFLMFITWHLIYLPFNCLLHIADRKKE